MNGEAVWYAVVLGGGAGTRMGLGYNKVLAPLAGEPVIRRSVRAFADVVSGAVIVCPEAERPAFEAALAGLRLPLYWASAGSTRQASVWNGLLALRDDCTHVLIHDGARCLVDPETIRAAMASAEARGSGIAAVPVSDTVKIAGEDGQVRSTLARETLRSVQTPQAFSLPLLLAAHRAAASENWLGTDDASLVERFGETVWLTPGSRRNLKLTTPEDLSMAEYFLQDNAAAYPDLRIGTGYDVHRFAPDRELILCGVRIPCDQGLDGHSDADVAVHALMDAMLGAAALGDIGKHFPDTDPAYRGISSMKLLRHVRELLTDRGLRVANCDITIVAQSPKLAPFIPAMRASLAESLELPEDRVSVKATTTERLGFEGRKEGISAQASVLLQGGPK